MTLYGLIAQFPVRVIGVSVLLLVGLATVPASWGTAWTPWPQSSEWARHVFQVGTLLVALVFGVVPIAKWYDELAKRITEEKPIVLTDRVQDGFEIRNVGDAPAMNVWLLGPTEPQLLALGSLDKHAARRPSPSSRQPYRIRTF